MKKEGMVSRKNLAVLFVCLIIVYSAGAIGSFFTQPAVNTAWYEHIKPSLTPPNWVFPVVWNILFLLIALAMFCSWIYSKTRAEKKAVILSYGINLVLNILWSVFYFGLKNPSLALLDLVFIWVSILWMMRVSCKICPKTIYFLAPYLLWITFAGILNYQTITGMLG